MIDTLMPDRLKHDAVVLQQAMALLEEGYRVEARLEGIFERPKVVIKGYRPDIVGYLGNDVVIIEVVKGDVDWPKLTALGQYAASHTGVRLELVDVEQ